MVIQVKGAIKSKLIGRHMSWGQGGKEGTLFA